MTRFRRITTRGPGPERRRWLDGAVLAAIVLVAGCGVAGGGATFDPVGPCVASGQAPGAYPNLESILPSSFQDSPPTMVDSGRNCADGALGSLATHDLDEVRFAGATWDLGGGQAVATVVFERLNDALPAAWMAEFYEVGARAGKKTDNIETSTADIEGAGEVSRLDVLNDLSWQSVVTWQDGARVRAVLVASPVNPSTSREAHDALVLAAIAAAVAAPDEAAGS